MKYQILECDTAAELTDAVTELLSQGWKPQGGVSVLRIAADYKIRPGHLPTGSGVRWVWLQAMIHETTSQM